MKKVLSLLVGLALASASFAADAANDVILFQRNAANDDNVQRNITSTTNALILLQGASSPAATTNVLLNDTTGTITGLNSITAASGTNLTLAGGTAATNAVRVSNTTAATNTTSGALQVGSNVGISGNTGGPSYFGGAIDTTRTGQAIRAGITTGVSSTSYAAFQGTDAGSVARTGYFGLNAFLTDGSLEMKNASGLGLAIAHTTGNATFGGNLTASGTGSHVFGTTNTVTMAAGDITATGDITASGAIIGSTATISASAIDWAVTNTHSKTLSANTTFTFSNSTAGQSITVVLTNTASNYTVTWPTVSWTGGVAPTMTTGVKTDVYTFIKVGSTIYGSAIQNF